MKIKLFGFYSIDSITFFPTKRSSPFDPFDSTPKPFSLMARWLGNYSCTRRFMVAAAHFGLVDLGCHAGDICMTPNEVAASLKLNKTENAHKKFADITMVPAHRLRHTNMW